MQEVKLHNRNGINLETCQLFTNSAGSISNKFDSKMALWGGGGGGGGGRGVPPEPPMTYASSSTLFSTG